MARGLIANRAPMHGRRGPGFASGGGASWTPTDLGSRLVSWWMRLGNLGTTGSDTVDVVDADSDLEVDTLRDLGHLNGGYARDSTRDLTQSTIGNRPTAFASVGGRYAVNFDQSAPFNKDGMSATNAAVLSVSGGGVCVVYRPSTVTTTAASAYSNAAVLAQLTGPPTGSGYQGVYLAQQGAWAYGWDGAEKSILFSGRGASEQSINVAIYCYNGTTLRAIVNDSGLQSIACGNITNLYAFTIGDPWSSGFNTAGITGDVYEAFAFTSASDAELQQMANYAASRWAFSATWTPASVYGMASWFRSDSVSTSGGVVDSMTNRLSGGANATASGTARPAYNSTDAAYNGLPSLSFDGTDDTLLASGVNYSQHTIFMVARSAGQAGYRPFYRRTAITGNDIDYCSHRTDALFIRNNALTASYKTNATNWGVTANPITIRVQYDGTHAGHLLYANGSAVALTSATAGDPGALTNGNLRLMSDSVTYTQGTMAEFIVYNRVLSAAEITLVENYLRTRYAHY
jgi:hypothetical protein